jgi:hypothetical protein
MKTDGRPLADLAYGAESELPIYNELLNETRRGHVRLEPWEPATASWTGGRISNLHPADFNIKD